MQNEKSLEDLYKMRLHDIWQPNSSDLVLRVPGGWVYTLRGMPVFIPEPHPMLTYSCEECEKADDETEAVIEMIEQLEKEETVYAKSKTESIPSESVQSDDTRAGSTSEGVAETSEVCGCDKDACDTDAEIS